VVEIRNGLSSHGARPAGRRKSVRPSVADAARNHAGPPVVRRLLAARGSVEIRRRRRTQLAVKFNRTRRGIAFQRRRSRWPPRTKTASKNPRAAAAAAQRTINRDALVSLSTILVAQVKHSVEAVCVSTGHTHGLDRMLYLGH